MLAELTELLNLLFQKQIYYLNKTKTNSSFQFIIFLSTEKELARMRTQFVERVTAENLTQLLEALVTDNVLNELEKERIQEINQSRADKARDFIDIVKKKGEKACRIMISHLRTIDPTVSRQLGLSSGPSAHLGEIKYFVINILLRYLLEH